jgi:hypothetical protein
MSAQDAEDLMGTDAPRAARPPEPIAVYTPGAWSKLPLYRDCSVAVVLNAYHQRNLRWLLRHAWHGTLPKNGNTGDWCGEILWALEQAMRDNGITGQANGPDGGWPLEGFGDTKEPTHLEATLYEVGVAALARPESSGEAIQAALYAAQDTRSASDVEHVQVMLRAAYAVDFGAARPPEQPDGLVWVHRCRGTWRKYGSAVCSLCSSGAPDILNVMVRAADIDALFGAAPPARPEPSAAAISAACEVRYGYSNVAGNRTQTELRQRENVAAQLRAAYAVDLGAARPAGTGTD